MGDMLGAGGVEETDRTRVRCDKVLRQEVISHFDSPLAQLMISYIKGKIYRACDQSMSTYASGTETRE